MKKYIYLLMTLPFITSCGNDEEPVNTPTITRVEVGLYEECTNIPRPNDTYVFPAYPGTPEWERLNANANTILDVVKALQIPENILTTMSIEGLVHTYLDYPFADETDTGQTNSYQDVINADFYAESAFNGCKELMRRTDTGLCVLNIYKDFNPVGCDMGWNIHAILLRLMLVPEIHEKLSLEQKKEFVATLLQKRELCLGAEELDALEAKMAFASARIMQSSGYVPFVKEMEGDSYIQWFVNMLPVSGNVGEKYNETITWIITLANDFIK